MPNPPQDKRADTQSKDTTFSGLPKAVRLALLSVSQTMTLNTFVTLVYNTVIFNYGGYAFKISTVFGAPTLEGIIIPEPGVYEIKAQMAQASAGQAGLLIVFVNGSSVLPDGTVLAGSAEAAAVSQLDLNISGLVELKAGDVVTAQYDSIAASTPTLAQYQTLTVEKRGGQY